MTSASRGRSTVTWSIVKPPRGQPATRCRCRVAAAPRGPGEGPGDRQGPRVEPSSPWANQPLSPQEHKRVGNSSQAQTREQRCGVCVRRCGTEVGGRDREGAGKLKGWAQDQGLEDRCRGKRAAAGAHQGGVRSSLGGSPLGRGRVFQSRDAGPPTPAFACLDASTRSDASWLSCNCRQVRGNGFPSAGADH